MQQGQAVYYPASSSASSANFLNALPGQAASGDARNCTCCSDRNGTCSNSWEASNGSTFSSQLTPPEHALTSCPSSSFSASTATSGTSPTVYPEFLYPPLPPQSVLPSTSSGGALNHFQHHLPKSLSRSSISSNGSTLLFSPSLEAHTLHNYSPLTPPLPLPLEGSSKGSTLPPQTLKLSRSAAPSFNSNPPSQIPILPNMQVTAGSSTQNSSFNPSFLAVTPACISQLATYLAEMMVYLWFSPPQKRAPTFPKPTSAFARFCNDILTTTQVSQSVVVLALYFVCKLQTKHSIEPRQGSEYKLTIASLMLANKILDDHTYTNKTWSEVSGLPLNVLNGAEEEFLQGLEFDLHVSHTAYLAWYTMLQNGESSIVVKQSAPARKKAKVVNPIAPSAPTSPLHHTSTPSTSINSGLGFDFTFAAPSTSAVANAAYVHAAHQPYSVWPSTLPSMGTRHLHPTTSTETVSGAEPTFPARKTSNRKRRLSDAALSPPRSVMSAETSSKRNIPLRIAVNNPSSAHAMPPLHALPPHLYTPIVSTPTTMPSAGPSRSSTPTAQQNSTQAQRSQGYPMQNLTPAEFNALTSSWTPVNEVGERRPQDLTYYALAAGQQRGGYLTHQPLQSYPAVSMHQHYAGLPMHQAPDGRIYAPLPRSALLGSTQKDYTPTMQKMTAPPRTSLSLSPVDMRVMYQQHNGRDHPHSTYYSNQMLAPGHHNMQHSIAMPSEPRHTSSATMHGYTFPNDQRFPHSMSHGGMLYSQPPYTSPLEPSLQSLALSGPSLHGTATPVARVEPEQKQHQAYFQPLSVPYQSYYSSFANNGLPGVLSWPVQAIAKYHNVVQPQ